jgi:hypothetical protein
MTNNDFPRLCGGTFFTLVLQALKPRMKAREHYDGDSDGLSDPDAFVGLLRVINPDYQEPQKGALKGKTNDYKACKISKGEYLPFGDMAVIQEFDNRVHSNYSAVLSDMGAFVERFLETETVAKKDVRLTKALLNLIDKDKAIGNEEEFFVLENGDKIKKAAFSDLSMVCFPAFLLGVWHYAVMHWDKNGEGKSTYDKLCPPAGGGKRYYKGTLGETWPADITLTYTGPKETVSVEAEVVADSDTEDKTEEHEEAVKPAPQMMFNFNVTGNNNSFVNHVDKIENHYYGGKKDGK